MAKKSASSKASAPVVAKSPEVKASGAGEYRANRAFAFKMERIERGATITLTAEEATALGDTVTALAPREVQSDDQTDAGNGSDKQTGQDGAADEDAAGASTAAGATGTEAANEDQTV